MAASYADLTRLDAILRDRPLMDGVIQNYNKATPLLEKITNRFTVSGRKLIQAAQFGANEGHYMRADRGTFGTSHVQSPSLFEIASVFAYSIFEISGPVISASRDQYAFEEALALSLESTLTGARLDRARRLFNGSAAGVIALVQSKTSTVIVEADSPYGLTSYKGNVPVRNIIRVGMPLDVIDTVSPPATLHHDDDAVSAVSSDSDSTTITFDTAEATAPADGDYIAKAGNYGYENVGIFNGLFSAALGGTDTYLNVARASKEGWNAVLVDAADGGATAVSLDPDMLRDTLDQVQETSGERPDIIVCNYKQRRNMYNLLAAQIRYAPMNLPGGLTENTLTWDDIPVMVERFAPPQHILFLNLAFWAQVVEKEFEWLPGQNGTVLHSMVTVGSDTYRAVGAHYGNGPITTYPATNAVLYGVSEA
jgi:hypothetical protein